MLQQIETPLAATQRYSASPEVLCYRINGSGEMKEGFEIELEHPLTLKRPALFVGRRYMLVDHQRACDMQEHGTIGIALNAAIDWPRITRSYDNDPLLLHVNPIVELAPGAKHREMFWTGVKTYGGARITVKGFVDDDGRDKEVVVGFDADDSYVDIFYDDGKVVRIKRECGLLVNQHLSASDQAQTRIENALTAVQVASRLPDPAAKGRGTDAGYHQIASVLTIVGRHSKSAFDDVFNVIEGLAKQQKLSKGVLKHVLQALEFNGAEYEYFRDNYCCDLDRPTHAVMQFGMNNERRGAPVSRKAFVAARAAQQKLDRGFKSGSSGAKAPKNTEKSRTSKK